MPPIPKHKAPIYNKHGVQAPPLTEQFKVQVGPGQYEMIAVGTTTKQSWEGIFQLPGSGSGLSRKLEDSIMDMTEKSCFFRAYITKIIVNRGDGAQKEMLISQKQALSIILKRRAAWDQELSASDGRTCHNNSYDIIVAGAIYHMSKLIPRNKHGIFAHCQLWWHEYYDDVPELLLWAVLHKFLVFLNRYISKRRLTDTSIESERNGIEARPFERSLGKSLFNICQAVSEAPDNDNSCAQPTRRERSWMHRMVADNDSDRMMNDDRHSVDVANDGQPNAGVYPSQNDDFGKAPYYVAAIRSDHNKCVQLPAINSDISAPSLRPRKGVDGLPPPADQQRNTVDRSCAIDPLLLLSVPKDMKATNATSHHDTARPRLHAEAPVEAPKRKLQDLSIDPKDQQSQTIGLSHKKLRSAIAALPEQTKAGSVSGTSIIAMEEVTEDPDQHTAAQQESSNPDGFVLSPAQECRQNYNVKLLNRSTTGSIALNSSIGRGRPTTKSTDIYSSHGKALPKTCQMSAARNKIILPIPVQREGSTTGGMHPSNGLVKIQNDSNKTINDCADHDREDFRACKGVPFGCQNIDLWLPPPLVNDHPLYHGNHKTDTASDMDILISNPDIRQETALTGLCPQRRESARKQSSAIPLGSSLPFSKELEIDPSPNYGTRSNVPRRKDLTLERADPTGFDEQDQNLSTPQKSDRRCMASSPSTPPRAVSHFNTNAPAREKAFREKTTAPATAQAPRYPQVVMYSPPVEDKPSYNVSSFDYAASVRPTHRGSRLYADPKAILRWLQRIPTRNVPQKRAVG